MADIFKNDLKTALPSSNIRGKILINMGFSGNGGRGSKHGAILLWVNGFRRWTRRAVCGYLQSMPSDTTISHRRRAVPLYAVLCALTGLSGLTLSLTAHPDGVVYRFEQQVADEAANAPDRTALLSRTDVPAGML